MQFAELGFSQSHGTSFDDAGDDAADGIALSLDAADELSHFFSLLWVRAAHVVLFCQREVVLVVVLVECNVSHLRGICLYADARLLQGQLSQSTAHNAADGNTCR